MTDDVWREFFDSCAPQYMNEVLALAPGASVLDESEIMVVMRRPAA